MNIITIEEAKTLGRPIGKVADAKIACYIAEVEQTIIKPAIGDDLFLQITDADVPMPDDLQTLLNGGTYAVRDKRFCFVGLKVAMAYFVSAQNVISGDFESTRFGMVVKQGEYSNHVSQSERSDLYNSIFATANAYLRECVAFLRAKGLLQGPQGSKGFGGSCIIRKID